jgi:hypothetical protein
MRKVRTAHERQHRLCDTSVGETGMIKAGQMTGLLSWRCSQKDAKPCCLNGKGELLPPGRRDYVRHAISVLTNLMHFLTPNRRRLRKSRTHDFLYPPGSNSRTAADKRRFLSPPATFVARREHREDELRLRTGVCFAIRRKVCREFLLHDRIALRNRSIRSKSVAKTEPIASTTDALGFLDRPLTPCTT